MSEVFREYKNEIPMNTIRSWGSTLLKELKWEHLGWTGHPKEPYRHWACYPELDGIIKNIWDTMNVSFKEDGLELKPERVIANLFNHGDSSWLHKDCDDNTAWTALIYLNDYWNKGWYGGTIVYPDDDSTPIYSEPTPGKFILFKSNLLHGSCPVSREADFPRFGMAIQCGGNVQRLAQIEVSSFRTSKL